MRKVLGGIFLTVALLVAGCGSSAQNGSSPSSTSQSGSNGSKDLSSIGKKPDFSWHDSYMTGKHASFGCGDTCHTLALTAKVGAYSAGYEVTSDRKQICYQCHAANYNATSYLKHSSYNIGTYCNSCHYSDSFKTHTRVNASEYHTNITTGCATCHSGRYPSSHAGSGRTSGCENCHSYKNGSWGITSGAHSYTSGCNSCHSSKMPANHFGTTCENCHTYPSWKGAKFSHSGITSGCASCHTRHYAGFSCEGCHTQGISWNFSHSRVSPSNCSACHDGNGEDGDDGGDDDGGDDDRHGSGGDHDKLSSLM